MLRIIVSFFIQFIILIFFFSCNKENINIDNKKNTVYAVGSSKSIIKYWTDSISQNLTNGEFVSEAYAIAISDNYEVFIVGCEKNIFNKYEAKIWKNGIAQSMGGVSSELNDAIVYDLLLFNNDVYTVGYVSGLLNKATLWKNGIRETLSGGDVGYVSSKANAISISNEDIYIAGNLAKAGKSVAGVWKNEEIQILSDDYKNAEANDIIVSDGNVYVVGNIENGNGSVRVAALWKNGKLEKLTKGLNSETAGAHAIAISHDNVYIAGFERKSNGAIVAIVWKNGVAQELTNDKNSFNDARAYSIVISEQDVYVGGVINSNAAIWKNGKLIRLKDNKASNIFDIAVK